tara:strand:+ start:407 stop:1441 length:1035 start_codon:yes stop_codon:yes gene_type:complete
LNNRILYITPGFPSDESDTSCIPALQEFFEELKTRNIDPLVVALHYPASKNYSWKGIPVHALGLNNPHPVKQLWQQTKISKQIQQLAIKHKAELVHSFWIGDAAWYGQNMAKALQIPHVITAMGRDFESKSYYKRVIKQNPKIVALSAFHELKLKENGLQPNQVIPHGLSPRKSTPIKKSIDLLFVGSLIELKHPFDFIECCKQLKVNGFEFQAKMIGSGPLEKKILERINSYGLENNIQLTGQLSREATFEIMDQSKVLYHPSRYESFGMVILEAIRSRMHVVSSPVGISPEIEGVHLVENSDNAAKIIQALLDSPAPESQLPFAIENTVDQYLAIYQSLLKA